MSGSRKKSNKSRRRLKPAAQQRKPPDLAEIADEVRAQVAEAEPPIEEFPEFWSRTLRSLGTEPQEVDATRGASGVPHPIIAAGLDEAGKRLVVVSAENDARGAALAQADLQSATDDLRVLVARPVIVSAQELALALAQVTGHVRIGPSDLSQFNLEDEATTQATIEASLQPLIERFSPWVQNATSLKDFGLRQGVQQLLEQVGAIQWRDDQGKFNLDLTQLFGSDPGVGDHLYGTCAFPIHGFSETELRAIGTMADNDEIRDILRRHHVLQYFFPAPDHLALGLVDRGAATADDVRKGVELAPHLGHPLGPAEIVGADVDTWAMIEALAAHNLSQIPVL